MSGDAHTDRASVTVEVHDRLGGTRTLQHCATEHAIGIEGLDEYAERATAHMRTGMAQVLAINIDQATVPIAVIAGGWPVEGMCCDVASPDSDDIISGDPRRRDWECSCCREVVAPKHWALMHLAEGPLGRWEVPDPEDLALACDVSVRDALLAGNRTAVAAARQLLDELQTGTADVSDPYVTFRDPHRGSAFTLGAVVVEFGERAGEGPDGTVFVGYVAADWDAYDPDRRRWALGCQRVGQAQVSAGVAASLLVPADRLRSRARQAKVTDADLLGLWANNLGAAIQPWLCDDAAVADLERVARTEPQHRGMSL